MSITKSYNKHTDTYYAYDTTYVWSEERQKKVQKKVCIGQYDKSGNIVPNAKRGRPSRKVSSGARAADGTNHHYRSDYTEEINQTVTEILSEIQQIERSLSELTSKSRELEDRVMTLQTRFIRKE